MDCRVRLAVILLGSLSAFFLQNEWYMGTVAVLCVIWLFAFGKIQMAITFTVLYSLLLWATISIPFESAFASLRILTNILRRFMMPAFFAIPLATASTGLLLATLNRLRLPRQMLIALAVVFRFMPTVAGEYQAIRTAQKFRGIGRSIWALLAHPARTYETILVPLLMRTTRIADELSASAMLRGAAKSGPMTSYRQICFSGKDACILCLAVVLMIALSMLDVMWR